MDWRVYALRFAFATGTRFALRTKRWSAEQKMRWMVLAPPAAMLVITLEVVWHVTGRGRRIRHALGYDRAAVIPGPRAMPDEFREQVEEWRRQP
ncbi:MAG TPA: hypothetical protein VJT75_02680 [Thermoleophilaceae bacterium]|nr:hypothetical protein [Thermoleophilaceae bacterium]